jgi:hypothetical protein
VSPWGNGATSHAVRPGGEIDERYAPERRAACVDGERFPLTLAAGAAFSSFAEDVEHGLDIVVAGMTARLAAPDPVTETPGAGRTDGGSIGARPHPSGPEQNSGSRRRTP